MPGSAAAVSECQHRGELGRRGFRCGFLEMNAGIVNQNGDRRPGRARGALQQLRGAVNLGHIMRHDGGAGSQRVGRLAQFQLSPPHQHDPRTRAHHAPRHAEPQAGSPSRNQCGLVVESERIGHIAYRK
jgi:hypothetical protein